MAIGLVQYTLGRKNLPADANTVPNPLPAARRPLVVGAAVGAVAVVLLLVLVGVITAANLANVTIVVIIAAAAYFAVILSSKRITTVERRRVFSFIPMFLASFVFFALYQQQFTVVTIYSDQRLDRELFGWEMPVSWVNSINPVFIIPLAQPSTPVKFALGTIIMGVAFLAFLPWAGGAGNTTPLLALVGILLLFTIAELLLRPARTSAG